MRKRLVVAALALSTGMATAAWAAPAPGFTPAPLPPEQALFAPLPQHDPRIAAGLSFLVNGTGQFYNHESAKGWWMLAPVLAYPVAWLIDSAFGVGYGRLSDAVLIVGVKGYSVWDAYREADRPVPHPGKAP
jgi:hypothetical protein